MNGPTLSDSIATTSAHGGTVVPTKKSHRKKMHTTIIPESAPSRNLQSRTNMTKPNNSSQGSVPLGPVGTTDLTNSELKSKGKVKKAVKSATQIYRLTSAEIQKDAAGVKVCTCVRPQTI